ncbi:uncharacterized protein LOC134539411 [Bacillus rossius redtenbacheri]|uniref:uncharacterized protein LOC134539411 n=1 Tax=Bacillus rossius redtenbacheri TaxID=93214 RepID=UPI002FDD7CAF
MATAVKKVYHNFDQDTLERAAKAVNDGMSYRKAEQKFGVPKSSIQRKVKNVQQHPYGRPPVLSETEEKQIAEYLALAGEWGFPLTAFDIRCIIKKYLDKKGMVEPRFKNNLPGKKWIKCFLARQCVQLKYRMCTNIKRSRAAVTPEAIQTYFEELSVSLADVPAEAILNYDETSMQDNPGQAKVVVRRKCKHPERIIDFTKSTFSVMFSGSASGVALPPYVVYKAENLYDTWTEGGPPGTRYNRSKSGWFEGNIFQDWFLTIALPYLKRLGDGPKAVIGDNLASHISATILKLCVDNNIRFIMLPPNSTHICQPLDLAFFSPLKTAWRKQLTEWKMKNKGSVRKDQFPRLLKKTLDAIGDNISTNLKSGFKKSGIFPVDKQKVLESLPSTSSANESDVVTATVALKSSFEAFLQQSREKETGVKQRKKKLIVNAGKSLAAQDVLDELQKRSQPKSKQTTKQQINTGEKEKSKVKKKRGLCQNILKQSVKKMKMKQKSDTSEDSDCEISLHDSNSSFGEDFSTLFDDDIQEMLERETLSEQKMVYEDVEPIETVDICGQQAATSMKENDFVVVEVTYDKGKKYECKKVFIGKIVDKKNSRYKVSYMRNYLGSKDVFVFPTVEDIEDGVPIHRIKKVITPQSENRGRFKFLF